MNNSNTNEHNWAKVVKKRPTTKIKSSDLVPGRIQFNQVLAMITQFLEQQGIQRDRISSDPKAYSQEIKFPIKLFLFHRALESRIVFFSLFHFA